MIRNQLHGPGLSRLREEATKLLNRPFQGVQTVANKIGAPLKEGGRRFRNVFAAPLESVGSSYEAPVFRKTEQEREFLLNALKHYFVFADLSARDLMPLVEAMEKTTCSQGEVIIEQGEAGDYFYVLSKGTCDIVVDGESVAKLEEGDSFGELALLYSSPRAATVTSLEEVVVFRVDQKTFRMIFQNQVRSSEERKRERLEQVHFLQTLAEEDKQKLVDHMAVKVFKAGDQVMTKGQEADFFMIVDEGELLGTNIEVAGQVLQDMKFEAGGHCGEHAMLSGTPLLADVIAKTDGLAFVVDKSSIFEAIGDIEEAAGRALGRKVMVCGWD